MNARTSRSGRAAVACCVIEVARPAHTPTSARDPRSVIVRESANWLMRQAIGCSSDSCAHRLPVGLRVLEPVDEFGREADRILLVGEVPQTVEKSPSVGSLDVLAGPAELRVLIAGSSEPWRCSVGTRTGRFMRRLNWTPSGRASERTIQRYGSIEQWAVEGMHIARR